MDLKEKVIFISHDECDFENISATIAKAVMQLKENGGGTLVFEKGEYHFKKIGTTSRFFGVTNNNSCNKDIAFFIENAENITIDANGSLFVFHDLVSPFIVTGSKNISIKNLTVDCAVHPVVSMKVAQSDENGFKLIIDKGVSPWYIDEKSLVFKRLWGDFSGREKVFDIHATDEFKVQFMVTGECSERHDNLPVSHVCVDAMYCDDGVYMKYRADNRHMFAFKNGSEVTTILDGRRDLDVIVLDNSENIKISDITVRCGIGMGIIAQFCKNIEVERFCTDMKGDGIKATLTADALHFVNCSGYLNVHDCTITDVMDDVINVHGIYTVLDKIDDGAVYAKLMHYEQFYFMPYKPGDTITFINPDTLKIHSEFKVKSAVFEGLDGNYIKLEGDFTGHDLPETGMLIENPARMPDLHLYNNCFKTFPHMRISGGGKMLIENNTLENAGAALVVLDLAKYWYESGRVNHLEFCKNKMDGCNNLMGESFITVGVDGFAREETPKVHKEIKIYENEFKNLKHRAIVISGTKDAVIYKNDFETDDKDVVSVV